jgi:hypothetical protein
VKDGWSKIAARRKTYAQGYGEYRDDDREFHMDIWLSLADSIVRINRKHVGRQEAIDRHPLVRPP